MRNAIEKSSVVIITGTAIVNQTSMWWQVSESQIRTAWSRYWNRGAPLTTS